MTQFMSHLMTKNLANFSYNHSKQHPYNPTNNKCLTSNHPQHTLSCLTQPTSDMYSMYTRTTLPRTGQTFLFTFCVNACPINMRAVLVIEALIVRSPQNATSSSIYRIIDKCWNNPLFLGAVVSRYCV